MKAWVIGFLIIFSLGGCAQNTSGVRIEGQTQNVFFNNSALGKRLSIDNISTVPSDDRVRAIVQLTSQNKNDQHIQYRFYWYNDDGLEVNLKSAPWRKKIIHGFETVSLSEVTINPNGTQFRLQIREADDG